MSAGPPSVLFVCDEGPLASYRECDLTLLKKLVDVSHEIGSTRSRSAKIAGLSRLLGELAPDEILTAVAQLCGVARQGKVGVGWAAISAIKVPPAAQPTLSIGDLDEVLDLLQRTVGQGSAKMRAQILADFLSKATGAEADFVRRLLVGELRQGALEGLMTDAVAKASSIETSIVRRALMLSGNLGEVARLGLIGGAEGLEQVGLELMRPIKPMLASISENLEDSMKDVGIASVEWKIDGIRIQVHRDGDEVRIFTRNLNDATDWLSEVVGLVKSLPARRLVLDGEALGAVPFFFDCIHLDGSDLIDLPLEERMDALESVAKEWRVPAVVTSDLAVAEGFLDEALAAGHEGVMVKAIDSTYQAGRRGKAWKKVKPIRSLDLVIIGAEWGHGRRRGWLSNLHLAARAPEGGFLMVGKTFKGLTDDMLRWQTEKLLELETSRTGITVFVKPQIVVEIELDGVMFSTRYPGGVGLRFARVKRYRDDKGPDDADTIEAVRTLLA